MAQVSLRINGYAYILGCADGEEDHLQALAADLDQRIDDIKASAGPSGEARLLLMAALVLSDELFDLRREAEALGGTSKPAEKPDQKAARRLSRLAKRAEAIADRTDLPLHANLTPPADGKAPDPENTLENIAAPAEQS